MFALRSVASILLLAVGGAAAVAGAQPLPDARPNIVFILADDLGYGDIGPYGQQKILTPHLDRLAAQGMRFTQFYAGSTVCAPSRSVLMTGQHSGHTTVRGNAVPENAGPQRLRAEDVTVAAVLKREGYATALIGKWGLGMPGDPSLPNQMGFDHFFGYLSQYHAHNHFPDYLWRNDRQEKLRNEVTPVGDTGAGYATSRVQYADDVMAEDVLSFITANRQRPFFVYYSPVVPHANNEAFKALGDGQEVPDYGPYAAKDWSNPNKGQAAMITRLDGYVGRILGRIQELGLDERTLVIFTSDNGPHAEGGNDPAFFAASGPLRGRKRDLYEGGIRVPFLARWPTHVKPGVSDHAGYFGDMMSTLAELTGATPPADLDSVSIVPTLLGRKEQQRRPEYLYWEFHEAPGRGGERAFSQAVLLDGRWKGIRLWNRQAPVQLYDLANDVHEDTDTAARHPDLVRRITEIMANARSETPHWSPRDAPQPAR